MDDLLHLAFVWCGVYLAVILARRTRLTPVLYYLAIGAILVNVGLLPEQSSEFIRGLAELGILFIMFALGFEEDAGSFVAGIRKSWGIALFGALGPFLATYFVARYIWGSTEIALLTGLAMSATAVSLTMVSLRSEGLGQSVVAQRILTSSVLDHIGSLILVAVLVPIATGTGDPGISGLAIIILKAAAFFLLVTGIARYVFPNVESGWVRHIPLLGRHGITRWLGFDSGQHATLLVLLVALATGMIAHVFGLHPAVGAYMAGLILREEYFLPHGNRYSYRETSHVIDIVAFSVVGPVFFVELGSRLVFDWSLVQALILPVALLTVSIIVAQIFAASIAARFTGGMNWPASIMIGLAMLGRAEIAFIVMDIGYVQYEIMSKDVFYTLMATTFMLNLAVPVAIVLWKPHYLAGLSKSERTSAGRDSAGR